MHQNTFQKHTLIYCSMESRSHEMTLITEYKHLDDGIQNLMSKVIPKKIIST
jgi:hypothetical protein